MPVFELLRENETRLYENDETKKKKKHFVVSVRINVTEYPVLVCKKNSNSTPIIVDFLVPKHIFFRCAGRVTIINEGTDIEEPGSNSNLESGWP